MSNKMMEVMERLQKLETNDNVADMNRAESERTTESRSRSWAPTAIVVGTRPFDTEPEIRKADPMKLATCMQDLGFVLEAPPRSSIVKFSFETTKLANMALFRMRKALASSPSAGRGCWLERDPEIASKRRHLKRCTDRIVNEFKADATTQYATGEICIGDIPILRMSHSGCVEATEHWHDRMKGRQGTFRTACDGAPPPRRLQARMGKQFRAAHGSMHRERLQPPGVGEHAEHTAGAQQTLASQQLADSLTERSAPDTGATALVLGSSQRAAGSCSAQPPAHPATGESAGRSSPHTQQFGHQRTTQCHFTCIGGHTLSEPSMSLTTTSSRQIHWQRSRCPTQARLLSPLPARSAQPAVAARSCPRSQPQANTQAVQKQPTRI